MSSAPVTISSSTKGANWEYAAIQLDDNDSRAREIARIVFRNVFDRRDRRLFQNEFGGSLLKPGLPSSQYISTSIGSPERLAYERNVLDEDLANVLNAQLFNLFTHFKGTPESREILDYSNQKPIWVGFTFFLTFAQNSYEELEPWSYHVVSQKAMYCAASLEGKVQKVERPQVTICVPVYKEQFYMPIQVYGTSYITDTPEKFWLKAAISTEGLSYLTRSKNKAMAELWSADSRVHLVPQQLRLFPACSEYIRISRDFIPTTAMWPTEFDALWPQDPLACDLGDSTMKSMVEHFHEFHMPQ